MSSKNYADALRKQAPAAVAQPQREEAPTPSTRNRKEAAGTKRQHNRNLLHEDEFPLPAASVRTTAIKQEEQEDSPSSAPRASAWVKPKTERAVTSTASKPHVILKRPKEEPNRSASGTANPEVIMSNVKAKTMTKKKPSASRPARITTKKPRPRQMSLGDVIPDSVRALSKRKNPATAAPSTAEPAVPPSTSTTTSHQQQQPPPKPMQVTSHDEFPSLTAAAGTTAAPPLKPKASLPAHTGWGKQPKKAKLHASAGPPPPKRPAKAVTGAAKLNTARPVSNIATISNKEAKDDRKPSLLDFGAKQRTDVGGEHDLIRLLQDGKMQSSSTQQKTGRQRITPRKKKFTTLKKKVLQERLEAWRKANPDNAMHANITSTSGNADTRTVPSGSEGKLTCTVCLHKFATSEEVEDEDEYDEIVSNFKEMATKVGPIRDVYVHRQTSGGESSLSCPAFVWFESPQSAAAASACWKGMTVGGESLKPVLLYPQLPHDIPEQDEPSHSSKLVQHWRDSVLSLYSTEKNQGVINDSYVTSTVILRNALTNEDFQDQEHLDESLSSLRSLVEQHGIVSNFETKQDGSAVIVVATFADAKTAKEAKNKLDGVLVGGTSISAILSPAASYQEHVLKLKNALTSDDLEDEDCLQESLHDIQELAAKYGPLSDSDPIKVDDRDVLVTFSGDVSVAMNAAAQLDGTLLGGSILEAIVVSVSGETPLLNDASGGWVLLQNLLTEDDIADEEGLEESIQDVKELASRYGKVLNVKFDPNDLTRVIKIEFDGGSDVAMVAASKFNGMVIGGQTVAATTLSSGSYSHASASSTTAEVTRVPIVASKPADMAPKPLYSGDKLIPERFAECKRVPKVLASTGPRDYASLSTASEEVVPLLIEMLGELIRLQRRAIEDKNAKARRRLVMGLREVARGIRAHKVKMVVMANNVDQYGAIDEKLQEILDLARQEGVPVIFELNKRKLGKAVGKTIKVSVVGIQNADGAHQQFKKLVALASRSRSTV